MKKIFIAIICLPFALFSQSKQYPVIDIPFKKFKLDNGLTLIIHEDHKLPIASFNIWYHVGSKNEKPGKTGFAHLFEHIMFTSTEHWSNFDEVLQTVGGGNNNGTTNNDRTNYFETFTSTGLDRVLWLEADRMGFLLNGLDSGKVNIQRGVVQNEKRQGENQPYAVAEELTVKATYPAGHPYSWTVIGAMEDLSAASMDDVKTWFKTYYGPNNAVVSIAGDVKADEVLEKVKKYFGDIPAGPPIAKFTNSIAKRQGVTFQQAEDRVPQARLQKTWNIPGWGSKELTHLNLLGDILTNGKSSRLYKRLVYDDQLASQVFFYTDEKEIGGQLFIFADAKPNVSLEKINAAINEELQKVFTQGVTAAELEKAKTNYFVRFLNGIEDIGGFGGKSDILAQSETYGGRPDYYKKILDDVKASAPADIKKEANDWLKDGEYVLEILPYENYTNTQSALDRKKMPDVSAPAVSLFPDVKNFTLSNGLKVYVVERHDLPLVNIVTAFNGGYAADKLGKPGLANITGNMLTEGTATRSATQISDQLVSLGTTLNAYASIDNSFLSMNSLKTNFDASLALFADVLLHPSFPVKDFERVRTEQLLNIEQEKAAPNSLGRRILPTLLYPKDYAYNTALSGTGTTASVKTITRDDLLKFHKTWYAPNNGFMVVVGDVSMNELKTKLETTLSGWKSSTVPAIELADVQLAATPSVYIIDKPAAVQSYIYAAEIAPSAMDKGNDAFNLMNNMLGGTFLSRLNMNLREDKHWSYGVYSGVNPTKGPGIFMARAPVQTDKTKESLQELLKELTQVNSTKLIAQDEFTKEQTSAVFSVPGGWQSNYGVINFLVQSIILNRGTDYPGKYSSILKNLTLTDIQNAAAKVVKPQSLTWLIIGDRSKIEAGIRELNFGPVKILDANGDEVK